MLTDTQVKAKKAKAKPYKVSDGRGLHVLVTTAGVKLWRLSYRFGGKQKTLALGRYPDTTLAKARDAAETARGALARGADPGHERKLAKLAALEAAGTTFKEVAGEYVSKIEREGRADITVSKARWLLDFAYPTIGSRPVSEITAQELLAVLRSVERGGRHETARRLRSLFGRVFRFAVATGRAKRDPAIDLRGALTAPKVQHRAAITDPTAIGELLRAIEGFKGQPSTMAALQLAPLVFLRPGELRSGEWSEIDLEAGVWTIPGERMKMRRPHKVPLSRQALAIFEWIKPFTGRGPLVFPGLSAKGRPISENTLNGALRRLGYASDQMTAHGFRAMAATRLNETGAWNPDAIERQLAHQESNDVRRAYARAEFWDERVRMMQSWADYLDELRLLKP